MRKKNFFILESKLKRAMIIIALFSIYSFCFSNEHNILNKVEKNCIWVNFSSITDSSRVDSLIQFSNKSKINTIFLETYNNGEVLNDKYLNDRIAINNLDTTTNNDSIYNPLKYFLNKASLIDDIKVYALFDVYKIWTKNYYPTDSTHIYYECPECLESDINGKSDKLIKLDKVQSLEWEGIFLSPMHPDVNPYIIDKILYLLQNYNFNGIMLDQVKYQAYYYGYNKIGMEIFHNEHNIDPLDINRGLISEYYGYKKSEADSIRLLWDDFRIASITNLIREINETIDTELIVSVKQSPEDSKNKWYQDWNQWLVDDIVDFIVIKNYTLDLKEFNYYNKLINRTYSNFKNYNKIIIGIDATKINSSRYTANKILSLRLQQFNNIGIHAYDEYKQSIKWYNPIYNTINFNISNE